MSDPKSEKQKVADAEVALAVQLAIWEEKMNKADEAKKTWMTAVGITKKPRTPFDGAPLSPMFPKTPINFHKGQPIVTPKKREKAKESDPKAFNPFEGAPLSPDFPKTPLRFYNGRVVGEEEEMVEGSNGEKEKKAEEVENKGEGRQSEEAEGDDRWYD